MAQPPRNPSTPTDPTNQGTAAGQLFEGVQSLTTALNQQNVILAGLSTLLENNFIASVIIAERMGVTRAQLAQVIASERDAIRELFKGKS